MESRGAFAGAGLWMRWRRGCGAARFCLRDGLRTGRRCLRSRTRWFCTRPTFAKSLQLAKAAIAAGFKLLLKRLGASVEDVKSIYLAGAFGNYVQRESAARIGLIEIGVGHGPHSNAGGGEYGIARSQDDAACIGGSGAAED